MKIHSEKNTNYRKSSRKAVQALISYILLAGFIFLGLPTNLPAQKTDDDPKNFKIGGEAVTLGTKKNNIMNKMPAESYQQMMTEIKKTDATSNGANGARDEGTVYVVLNIEFKTPAARRAVFSDQKKSAIKYAYVLTAIDRFADVFVETIEAWDAIAKNPNIVRVEENRRVTAPPPPDVVRGDISQAIPDNIVRGGLQGLTGKNVIIAVLDTGIDFRHPDFITYDQQGRPTSRISYLWDTSLSHKSGRGNVAPVKFPNGTSIGTLFMKDQLTAELRSDRATIPATDVDGHGTACASVAVGNGNADKMAKAKVHGKSVEGVAPDAEIIGVRLGYRGLENVYLLNAIAEWLDKVAGKTPLVVSGSFGGHFSGHDGQRVEERQLNARFPLDKAGRAIVFAAGNEGADAIHAEAKFSGERKHIVWNANRETMIQIYFDSADDKVRITPSQATPLGDKLTWEFNPLTKQYQANLVVAPGPGGIWLSNAEGRSGAAHLYFWNRNLGSFAPQSVSYSHLVGSPGNMENAITVGSYDWNDNFHSGGSPIFLNAVCLGNDNKPLGITIGSLSCYSSPGPNRNGTVKPDIVAPGEWYSSSYAKIPGVGGAEGWKVDSTGNYAAMNGTSAATPYTSGIVALMFEKKPTLTLGEIKRLLKGNASKTGLIPFSQAIPNNNWGYGKLDMAAVNKIFSQL